MIAIYMILLKIINVFKDNANVELDLLATIPLLIVLTELVQLAFLMHEQRINRIVKLQTLFKTVDFAKQMDYVVAVLRDLEIVTHQPLLEVPIQELVQIVKRSSLWKTEFLKNVEHVTLHVEI